VSRFVLCSGADAGYFDLLADLVRSVRDRPEGRETAIGVLDLGLEPAQREWLRARGAAIVAPGWDLDFPRRERTPLLRKAQIARPFLPRHFPGHETYLWIDADAWVQEWDAVETLLATARRGKLAIVPELDRSYKRHYKRPKFLGMTLQWHCYRRAFGLRAADRLGRNPMVNCGVFALAGDSPAWRVWAETMARALERTNFVYVEQIALNHAIFTGAVAASFLPATCNWLCGDAAPMWDAARRRCVEPNAPHAAIGILHLAGEGQKSRAFALAALEGGTVETGLRYAEIRRLQDRGSAP
jgi:hypothetical protein